MNVAWFVAGIGLVAVLARRFPIPWPERRGADVDLGFVSHQWLMEHRLSQISDPQR